MFFASWQFEFELEKFEKYNQKTKSETYLHRWSFLDWFFEDFGAILGAKIEIQRSQNGPSRVMKGICKASWEHIRLQGRF